MKPSKQSPHYQSIGFALLRAPLLPFSHLQLFLRITSFGENSSEEQMREDSLHHALSSIPLTDPLFREALALASPSLFQMSIHAAEQLSKKKRLHVLRSLYRYLARMTTRPTPFGMCAGVARADIGEEMDIFVGRSAQHQKRTRPDMQWVLHLVRLVEQRKEAAAHLRFVPHPALLLSGGRLSLPATSSLHQEEIVPPLSLRATPLVLRLLELARGGCSLKTLSEQLWASFPESDAGSIQEIVDVLRAREILISHLRPPLTTPDPSGYVLSQLENLRGCADLHLLLERCHKQAGIYDQHPPGQGLEALRALQSHLCLLQGDPPMQNQPVVDLRLHCERATLSSRVVEEIARAACILLRLSQVPVYAPHLQAYRREFVARYGREQEVPLLELLDETTGLGPPPLYQFPPRHKPTPHISWPKPGERDRILLQLVMTTLQEQREELLLSEALVAQLQTYQHWQTLLPHSVEVYASVAAQSQQDINAGNYLVVIGPRVGDQPAGRAFGRFADLLGEETREELREIAKAEEQASPCLFAELVTLPCHGHAANVIIRPALRTYEIPIDTTAGVSAEHIIELSDLLVSLRGNRFSLRSRSHAREIIITSTHLLSVSRSSNLCRFLTEISQEGLLKIDAFDWGAARFLPFLPRIRAGKTILAPATWHLFPVQICEGISSSHLPDHTFWHKRFLEWRRLWRVPRFLYLCEAGTDRRLLLDLSHPLCLRDLAQICWKERRTRRPLCFQEMLPAFDQVWTQGASGPMLLEFVVPLRLQKLRAQNASPMPQRDATSISSYNSEAPVSRHGRLRLPGSDWLYVKLYGGQSRQNEVLVSFLEEWRRQISFQTCVRDWFFVRYHDPDAHLRLRFHGESSHLSGTFLPAFTAWCHKMVEAGLLSRYSIESYEREIERYGGEEGMALAERIFAVDSTLITGLLELRVKGQLLLQEEEIALCTMEHFLSCVGLPFPERLALYNMLAQPTREHGKENAARWQKPFHQYRKRAQQLIGDRHFLQAQPGGSYLLEALERSRAMLSPLGNQFHDLLKAQRLFREPTQFLASCLHLQCNRLGLSRSQEDGTLYTLWKTLESFTRYPPKGIHPW